ncbi:MAG: hypothetical protein K2Y22_14995 [Candidatus Obscuribacterales bacterium]|nr:hypothetical protein [Candidatus Obscuribacterales bacterium]
MKSMYVRDVYSESAIRESGFDSRTSRTLSKEASELDEEARKYLEPTLNSQDKLAMTAAAFIAGSPLGFLGLGMTFFFCDEMDNRRREEYMRNMSFNDHQQFAFNAIAFRAALADAKAKASAIPIELTGADRLVSIKPRKLTLVKDNVVNIDTRRGNRPYFAPSKNLREANKLIKRKEFLADQIKRLSQTQNYHAVCRLASEVELLDKAIKRLGY